MAFTKSGLADAGLFDEQLVSGGDFDLAIRLALQGRAVRTTVPLGYYLDAGLGASTSPQSKQLVERTLIELRYAIYDKIDWLYVDRALEYDVKHLFIRGERIAADSIPGVKSLIMQNQGNLGVSTSSYIRQSVVTFRNWRRKSL
jgi:hypothetical protein